MVENKNLYIDLESEDPADFKVVDTGQENSMLPQDRANLDGLLQNAIDTGINPFDLLKYQNQDRPWDRRFMVKGINNL